MLGVIPMRFGVVLGSGGGALSKMLPAFKFFAGGPLGTGMQWFPWIHIEDLAEATIFLIENELTAGPFNFCSPENVRYSEFTRTLGKVINRPAFIKTPAFVLKLIMGEMGTNMLNRPAPCPGQAGKTGIQVFIP